MPDRLLRPLLIFEFLVATETVLHFWSQVGGQYHLELMFWPWKFGLTLAAAGLITAMTAALARNDGEITRQVRLLASLLLVTVALAGGVTYYYHLNEPGDQDDDEDTRIETTRITRPGTRFHRAPSADPLYSRTLSEIPAYSTASR